MCHPLMESRTPKPVHTCARARVCGGVPTHSCSSCQPLSHSLAVFSCVLCLIESGTRPLTHSKATAARPKRAPKRRRDWGFRGSFGYWTLGPANLVTPTFKVHHILLALSPRPQRERREFPRVSPEREKSIFSCLPPAISTPPLSAPSGVKFVRVVFLPSTISNEP